MDVRRENTNMYIPRGVSEVAMGNKDTVRHRESSSELGSQFTKGARGKEERTNERITLF